MLLKDKIAVVYGAGGAIGGAVAQAFAAEGATVFATGRRYAPVELVTKEIVAAGGSAEATELDALDGQAVEAHLRTVVERAGRVDISFNAVGLPDAPILGTPMAELDVETFLQPVTDYARAYFQTATAAARQMLPKGSGVIMTVTALPARSGSTLNGGYGPAAAAKEALTRDLSAELAPHGIRVVGLRPHGLPETPSLREVFEAKAPALGLSWEQFQDYLAGTNHARRTMKLREVADLAVFMASDRASGMTGTNVNLSMGRLDD
ncbi:short-chain dehydrogenase [Streptacidiphilus pinicola]|uniref:Short-chain dehydrogenase n=1 Tax=Streptacidiphilus pinicola TaxID=2219663 RepID=A0A2X0KIT3_9ACTN|nr:SDR family oxidoreductase [Streptacidiphilus pinicola]RAG86650.1 short-chain dehydrogenase [Streptacidiphilus pinicola]